MKARCISLNSFGYFAAHGRARRGRFIFCSNAEFMIERLLEEAHLSQNQEARQALLAGLSGEISLYAAMQRLNRRCLSGFRLLWVGSFAQLCSDNTDFARCVRDWFRFLVEERSQASDLQSPLSQDEAYCFSQLAHAYRLGQHSALTELFC
jgi:hypothetical protein